jgi:integrase/recombinase XerD
MNNDGVQLMEYGTLHFYVGAFLAGYSSAATQRNYRDDLRLWVRFCSEECGIDERTAKRTHVELFARQMERAGRAPSSVKRRLATLSSFYGWLVAEEVLLHNPVANVRRPKVPDESVRR